MFIFVCGVGGNWSSLNHSHRWGARLHIYFRGQLDVVKDFWKRFEEVGFHAPHPDLSAVLLIQAREGEEVSHWVELEGFLGAVWPMKFKKTDDFAPEFIGFGNGGIEDSSLSEKWPDRVSCERA